MIQLWYYGSAILLLILCSNPFHQKGNQKITNQTIMGLTKEQITSIKNADAKLQLLKEYCKTNALDINTILEGSQKKEMGEALAFMKEFVPRVEQVEMAEFVIKKPIFAQEVSEWIISLKDYFTTISDSDVELIKTKKLKEKIAEKFKEGDDLNQFILDKLLEVIPDSPSVERKVDIANRLETVLKTIEPISYWEDYYKNIKKEYRKFKTLKGILPNGNSVGEVINHPDVKAVKPEDIARNWLELEMKNLQKESFKEDDYISCDTFRQQLETATNHNLQVLLCNGVSGVFEKAPKVQTKIVANIKKYLSGEQLDEIFTNAVPLIKNLDNNIVVTKLKENPTPSREIEKKVDLIKQLFEDGFKDIAESFTKITKENSENTFIDIKTLELESGFFSSNVLLADCKEDAMKVSDVRLNIDSAKVKCYSDPKEYISYLEKEDSLGIGQFATLLTQNSHNLSMYELGRLYKDSIVFPSSLSGKFKKERLVENLANCYLKDVGGYEILETLFDNLWKPLLNELPTDSEGYGKALDLTKVFENIEKISYQELEKELEKIVNTAVGTSDIEIYLAIAKDWKKALASSKDIKLAIDNAKYYATRPQLGGKDALNCVFEFKDSSTQEYLNLDFDLGVQPTYSEGFPILKLVDAKALSSAPVCQMWGDVKVDKIELGKEKYSLYNYEREVTISFLVNQEFTHTDTGASENTSEGGSSGWSVGVNAGSQVEPKLKMLGITVFTFPKVNFGAQANYSKSTTWATIKVGAKHAEGRKLVVRGKIDVTLIYTATLDVVGSGEDSFDKEYITRLTLKKHEGKDISLKIKNEILHGIPFNDLVEIFRKNR